ncbi:metal-dependent hydrolase family protein [Aestuariispira ectoiniformans]|uniref:metal-dependent hydrolase family protein n=1 Tax=Aestuariispira ectoiniformans TaxID=2775080 RepID=UPI00223ABCE0|nr:amidohydrolase family protein [Aestuariispira ectoiniformans]
MTILFKGGLVFDGKGETYEGYGVLVEGDRIKRVAPMAEFEGYAGEVVDTTGGTLMPGLTDCHVHLCMAGTADPKAAMDKLSDAAITVLALKHAQDTLRAGITSIRDCGGKDYLEFAVRDAIKKGEFQGPTIMASGRMICMTGGHGNRWGRIADGCDEVIKAVREQVHAGSDMIKIMATGGVMTPGVDPEDAHYTAEEMRAGVQEARRFRKTTASHAQGGEGILNAVRAGIHSIEHGIFMDDTCLEEMLAGGTYLVPTIAALRNIVDGASKGGIPPYVVEKANRVAERHQESFKTFYKAGGKIAMGTDAGTPFNRHGDNPQELSLMVDYGMAPKDALVCGTFNGADLMGLEDQGYVGEGAMADLLVVNGNPVEDINMAADTANHRQVFKWGEAVR